MGCEGMQVLWISLASVALVLTFRWADLLRSPSPSPAHANLGWLYQVRIWYP